MQILHLIEYWRTADSVTRPKKTTGGYLIFARKNIKIPPKQLSLAPSGIGFWDPPGYRFGVGPLNKRLRAPWTVTADKNYYEFCVVLENLGDGLEVIQKGEPIGVISFYLKDGLPKTNISLQFGKSEGPIRVPRPSEAVTLLMAEVQRPVL